MCEEARELMMAVEEDLTRAQCALKDNRLRYEAFLEELRKSELAEKILQDELSVHTASLETLK